MKIKYYVFFIAVFLPGIVLGQLTPINSYPILVNYSETVHLIFPSEIKYFNSVTDFVVVDNPENVKNILRIKANSDSFNKTTTVSVATADAQFYSYDVAYSEQLKNTNFIAENGSYTNINPETIYVNETSQTHLIAPSEIVYIDFGDIHKIVCEKAEGTENILRVIATEKEFKGFTNLSLVTKDNQFYTYKIGYAVKPPAFLYQIGSSDKASAIIQGAVKSEDKQPPLDKIKQMSRNIFNIGLIKGGVTLSLYNVFSNENSVFIVLNIKNRSSIPFDVDYKRFFIDDIKKSKNVVSQQTEVKPLYIENFSDRTGVKEEMTFVVAFEKFTVSNKQSFNVQINEKNGGRHLFLDIKSKTLIDAQVL